MTAVGTIRFWATRWPDETAGKIDYDFDGIGIVSSVVCQTALRAKMLDERANQIVRKHPDAVVVDLGAGLDSAVFRVDPPPTVDWYSVDLPGVISLRDETLPARPDAHSVAASLAEPHWADAIPGNRPTFLFADGLLAFLSEPVIIALFRSLTDQFRSGELAFNELRPHRLVQQTCGPACAAEDVQRRGDAMGLSGFKDAHHPESWNPKLRLVEETSLAGQPEVDLFPAWLRVSTRISARIPAMARKARILRYRF